MFDGNHRIRRNVDLGSSSNSRRIRRVPPVTTTTTTTTRKTNDNNNTKTSLKSSSDIIEETKRRREERRIQNVRITSTCKIQRIYRGYICRKHVVNNMIIPLMNDTFMEQTTNNNTRTKLLKLTYLINTTLMILVPCKTKQKQQQQQYHYPIQEWLLKFANIILDNEMILYNKNNHDPTIQQQQPLPSTSTTNTIETTTEDHHDHDTNMTCTTTDHPKRTTTTEKTMSLFVLLSQGTTTSNTFLIRAHRMVQYILHHYLKIILKQQQQQQQTKTEGGGGGMNHNDDMINQNHSSLDVAEKYFNILQYLFMGTTTTTTTTTGFYINKHTIDRHCWRRIGVKRNLLLLIECYQKTNQRIQNQQQLQKSNPNGNKEVIMILQQLQNVRQQIQLFIEYIVQSQSSNSNTTDNMDGKNTTNQNITNSCQAFHSILLLKSTTAIETTENFSTLVLPLMHIITTNDHSTDDSHTSKNHNLSTTNEVKNGAEKRRDEEDDDSSFLLLNKAMEVLITESPIQLITNALKLYSNEYKELISQQILPVVVEVEEEHNSSLLGPSTKEKLFTITSAIIQLLRYVLFFNNHSWIDNNNDGTELYDHHLNMLMILACKIVRGDTLNLMDDIDNKNNVVIIDDSDDDDDDEDHNETNNNTSSKLKSGVGVATMTKDSGGVPNHSYTDCMSQTIKRHSKKQKKTNLKSPQFRQDGYFKTTTNFTKDELQTVTKLDRKYSMEIHSLVQYFVLRHNNNNKIIDVQSYRFIQQLAEEISNPDLFIQWGTILFETMLTNTSTRNTVTATYESYIMILGVLLQFTTGLRVQDTYSSPFLSKVALSSHYISLLWKSNQLYRQHHRNVSIVDQKRSIGHARRKMITNLSMSIFGDIFAHSLIPIRDDTFIRMYTLMNGGGGGTVERKINESIIASDVISTLGEILYEVYWSEPVQVADLLCILPSGCCSSNDNSSTVDTTTSTWTSMSRSRSLLACTKLWNLLYERWNRLMASYHQFDVVHTSSTNLMDDRTIGGVSSSTAGNNNEDGTPKRRNHIMCDESLWWFPVLTGALASVSTGENSLIQNNRINTRRINMEMDDDDDGSDTMSIDSDNSNRSNIDDTTPMNGDRGYHSVAEAEGEALAEAFTDPKLARILTCIPQAVPFDKRVKLFDSLLKTDKRKLPVQDDMFGHQAMLAMMRGQIEDFTRNRREIKVQRDQLYSNSMEQISSFDPTQLKGRIRVSFINQHGTAEAGIDGGGVFKEFIDDLIRDGFSVLADSKRSTATYELFTGTPLQTLRVNSELFQTPEELQKLLPHYEFLGRVLGKAVYESILVEPQFCLPFLNQLLGKNNSFEDLKNYDPGLYQTLTELLKMSPKDLEGLYHPFQWTFRSNNNASSIRTVELVPGGSSKVVSIDNVKQFIHLVSHQLLNVETAAPTKAFLRGFRALIPASWVRLFSAWELQKIISGDDSIKGIDIPSFKVSMHYAAGYHESQPMIGWFWEIVHEMRSDQQRKLLKFMTSCSRQPLLGFGSLEPAPCIQQIRIPDAIFLGTPEEILKRTPLPTSSTCMNLLKLPNYQTKELMRIKLLVAIESESGFELT